MHDIVLDAVQHHEYVHITSPSEQENAMRGSATGFMHSAEPQ